MVDQPRRVNYVHGLLLGSADLVAEQEYHRDMRYRHNQLHGYGTVSGLEVAVGDGEELQVSPGWAIDALGREVVVAKPATVRLEPHGGRRRSVRDLVIEWHETAQCPVPVAGSDDATEPSRWVEQPELSFVAPGEAPAGALLLARVTRRSRGRVEVDTSVRRPLGTG